MPSEYIPKNPAFGPNRFQKIAKDLIKESSEDRKLALETHKFFREMVAANSNDSTAKNLMVECLKVAQASKNNVIKILNLVVKMEEAGVLPQDKTKASKGTANTAFAELSELLHD